MHISKYFRCLIPILLLFLSGPSGARPIIKLNITGKPPLNNKHQNGFMDKVAAEAFNRIGYQLKTIELPAERGLKNANLGIADGEMSRIADLEKIYPNLVPIPEPIMSWQFVAISRLGVDTKKGWLSLKGSKVGIINGWKILERNVIPLAKVTKVPDADKLFTLLRYQRVDIILYERWSGFQYLNDFGLKNAKIAGPPLATRKMYIYLNKKHKNLVPKLLGVLRQMKKDGTYNKLEKAYFGLTHYTGGLNGR